MIGLGIGSLIVFMMFPNHDWLGWTPGKHVMQSVRELDFEISPVASCQMQCLGITMEQIQLVRKDGKIDFGKSDVKQSPRIYHLDYGHTDFQITMNDSLATLTNIVSEGKSCACQ